MEIYLEASELLYRFFNRFELLDVGIHRVLFEIHFLGKGEHIASFGAGDGHDTVGIRNHDVTSVYVDSIT